MSNRIIKDTIAITVITLVAGLALGVVQDITADPIAKQEAQAKQDAYKAVFADADSFETVDVDADAMQSYLDENGYAAQSIDETMLAKDASGNELGYAFTVTTSEGYGGDIQFAMGIQDDGTLNGISILSIGETAGLGMRANTDAFKDQFKDKNVDKFEYTKTGATADDQIDALSGATITTNAMTGWSRCRSPCCPSSSGPEPDRARRRRQHCPCLIDVNGVPTTNPAVMQESPLGSLLTFAEHKGYALAAMCEILGGALSGGKTTHQETLQTSPDAILNCMTTIIINPELFGAPDCSAQTEAFAEWVKASPHDDDKPILLPGEWEVNTRRERQEQGIPLDAGSWQAICDAARQIGMSEETLQGFCQQLAS